jgi:hypothetical protein
VDDKPHPNYYVPCKKQYTYLVFFKGNNNNNDNNNNNKEMISGLQTLQLNAVFLNFNSWRK